MQNKNELLASVAGTYDLHTGASYGMANAGVIPMSRTLAVERTRYKIRVNTVSPWFTAAPLVEEVLGRREEFRSHYVQNAAAPRGGKLGGGGAVAFLAMDRSSYITGLNLSVDGGVTCRLL
jgi:tropinone reductase I